MSVESPCKNCLVHACCSKPCREYAIYVFETKQYVNAGVGVAKQIKNLPYEKAIEHILKVESVYFYMKSLHNDFDIHAPVAQ